MVAGELLEHLQFPDALVAEIRRVLEAGRSARRLRAERVPRSGTTPLPARPPAGGRSHAPAHVLARALRELLAGFEDVELDYVGGRYRRLHPRLLARDLVFSGFGLA